MLSLANVAGSGTPIGGGYLAALPGVALYCAALVWGLMRAGKTLKGWGLAAVIWGIACPLVFGLLGLLGAMLAQDVLRGNEDFGMLLAMVVCSGDRRLTCGSGLVLRRF